MRKLILPCLIFLCLSKESFSQGTCASAHPIPVASINCANYAMGALGSAPTANFSPVTATGITCTPAGSFPANRRVTWFRFTPATDILSIEFEINVDEVAQTQVAFYDPAAACGFPLTGATSGLQTDAGGCSATGQAMIYHPSNTNILRAGRTYYLRVYTNINHNNPLNINICARPVTIHTLPLDDQPHNYAVGPKGAAAGRNYSSIGGTSGQRCNYPNQDRRVTWFRFTPLTTTSCATFNINVDEGVQTEVAFFDPAVASPLIPVSTLCLPTGSGVFAPKTTATSTYSLTGGNNYYIRVYTNHNHSNPVNINIHADAITPLNDLCAGATQLDLNGINNETNSCMNGGATEPIPPSWACAGTLHNTAWYYIEVANSAAPTSIQIDQVACVGNASSGTPQIQVGATLWNGGNCQTAGILTRPGGTNKCYQGTASPAAGVITIPANTAGVVSNSSRIYIAIDGFGGANCTYRILPSNAIPIPVKIKLFTGWKQAGKNQLKWITTTELNNAYFEIERSTNGKDFVAIGRVEGAGNSNEDIQYKFDDLNYPMVAYYRLKQVDFDGQSDYTPVVMIKRNDVGAMLDVSFANPVLNSSRLTISTHRPGVVNMRVVDVSGRTISTQQVSCSPGNTTVMKDFSKLAAGSYYLVVIQGDDKLVKPFIKQ